jgi:TRAP-type mannitol/chloroaromatic compound transport system substrate-binding protein
LHWYDELENDVPPALQMENNSKWRSLPPEERQILQNAFPSADVIAS